MQRFCRECGHEVELGKSFCRACGALVAHAPPQAAPDNAMTPPSLGAQPDATGTDAFVHDPEHQLPSALGTPPVQAQQGAITSETSASRGLPPRPSPPSSQPPARGVSRRLWPGVVATVVLFLVAFSVYLLRANMVSTQAGDTSTVPSQVADAQDESPTQPSQVAEGQDQPSIDIESVNVQAMVPNASRLVNVFYPDLDGDGDEEIVAHARRPTGDLKRQDYLRAFTWSDGAWRTIFNAPLFILGGTGHPARVLRDGTANEGQEVTALVAEDLDTDGASELVIAVRSWTPEKGPLDLWVIGFPDREAAVLYYERAATSAGVQVKDGEVVLTTKRRALGPCCETELVRRTIGLDPEGGGIGLLDESVEAGP